MSGEEQPEPAKRVRMRRKERREFILHSAKHVFAHSTYADASTGELARESEITEPMLYKHFGSKKGLFLAVLGEFGTQFLDKLQERITGRAEKDLADALEHIIDDYRSVVRADPETQRIFFQAVIEASDPDVARCVERHNRTVYEIIHRVVKRAHKEGYLDPQVNIDAATWGYMSMILTTQYSMMLNLADDFKQAQHEVNQIWLRGLRSHEH